MGKVKAFFTGAQARLTTTFHVFKRRHLFQQQRTDTIYSVHQGSEAATDDSGAEQLIQQDDHAAPAPPVLLSNPRVPAAPQSTLKYVTTSYMDGSSNADYDSNADSAGQLSEEGYRRADDNIALRRIDSQVTTTKLSDNPDSEESVTSSDAANTLASILEVPEMAGEEGNTSGRNLPEGRNLRHRHSRSLTAWLKDRHVSLSSPAPSSRHLSSGNSSTDTFGRWRNRRPSDRLTPAGVPDPFLNTQPAPEPRQPAATTLEDLDDDSPFDWGEEYDKFSSDGKQRKVEQTAPGEFALQPREYRLNTPRPRQHPEEVRILKRRWRDQAAAANTGVPVGTQPIAAGNAYAHVGNVGAAQPAPFQPGAAIREVQARMEAMYQAFWDVDGALRQLDHENQIHQQNVRSLVDRNQALEQELEEARAAVRERDEELDRLREAVALADRALQVAQRSYQSPQNGPSGSAARSPPPVLRPTPPRTPWNRMAGDYANGFTMRSLSRGAVAPQTSSAQEDSEEDSSAGTVIHHEVADQVSDLGAGGESRDASGMYDGDEEEGWVDEEDSSEDDAEGEGVDLSYNDLAVRPDLFEYRETASESGLQDLETKSPPERRMRTC